MASFSIKQPFHSFHVASGVGLRVVVLHVTMVQYGDIIRKRYPHLIEEKMPHCKYRTIRLSALALTVLAVIAFTLGCYAIYQKQYDQQRTQMRAEAQRMLHAFEQHSTRLFDYADSYLHAIRAYRADFGNGDKWEKFVYDTKAPHAEAFTGIVTIVDRDGWVIYQSETPIDRLKSFGRMSGLDHYQYFINHPGDSLFVGATRLGKMTGKMQFRLARPLLKNGIFDGMVILTLLPEHITDFYRDSSVGEHSTTTMLTQEQKLIARQPPAPPSMYDVVIPDLAKNYGVNIGRGEEGHIFGTTGPFDHLKRDVFYKTLADYPVTLINSIAEQDIYDAMSGTRRSLFLFVLAFTGGAVLVWALLMRTLTAQEKAEGSALAAAESERFIKTITDATPGMVGYWDKDLCCRFANKAYQEWFGKPSEALIGANIQDLLGERLFALNEPYIRGALAGMPQAFQRSLTKADGSIGHVWSNYVPDIDNTGLVSGFFVLVTDVTVLKEAEAELKVAASVFQNTNEGIFITDGDGTIRSVNPAFTEITGYSAEEAIGQTPRLLRSNRHEQEFHAAVWREIVANGQWQGEIWNRRKSGEVFLEWQAITKVAGMAGEPCRYISLFHDVTDVWRKDEHVRHLAFHDALTELPNRSLLTERLERHFAMAEREQRGLAVMFLDLDRFKLVNDTLGHEIGDELLKAVAQRLRALVRQTDTVARLGGDEFVIMLDNPADRDEVTNIASRIIATVNGPMEFRGKSAQVGTSIGIAMYPNDGHSPADLIKNADTAMYRAKNAGKNTYRFFDSEMAA